MQAYNYFSGLLYGLFLQNTTGLSSALFLTIFGRGLASSVLSAKSHMVCEKSPKSIVLCIWCLQAGFAPLHLAVLQMTTEAVNFLLRLEVDPNVRDHQGRTPLHLIIEGPFSEALGSSNQCKNPFPLICRWPLLLAGWQSNFVCLFSASPGVVGGHCCRNMCPHDRYVYLSSWCSEPQTDNDKAKMVELLIKNGADPNAIDSRGKTPLHLASTVRSVEVARVLLHNGADPNICDEKVLLHPKIVLSLQLYREVRGEITIAYIHLIGMH